MKRILLSFATLIATTLIGYAQHTQTTTGFTNNCDAIGTIGTDGFTFDRWPTDGGWDETMVDTLKFGYYVGNGGTMYTWMDLNTAVDLTAPNNILDFYMAAMGDNGADTTQTINIKLEASGITVSEGIDMTITENFSHQQLTFIAASGQNLSAVTRITFTLPNTSGSHRIGDIFLTKLKAGSGVTASTTSASLVSSSKLFPNPVSDEANVELNLKSASSVKVTLSDLMGKEVMTIADGNFSSLNKSFSVAGLNKGIYTVNYFVNGAAAKAEMLMVK
jgi:hypothetical protein